MAKFIKIQVAIPCLEKWEHMKASSEGNFCNSCQKTVIDFTKMTDNQLMEYFKKPVANVCGRFYDDQLEMEYDLPVKRIPWLKYFFQISIPALLFNFKATAQQLIKKNTVQTEQVEKKQASTLLQGQGEVNGCITDFSGAPVAFATVMIVGTNKGTATDSNGEFTLMLSADEKQLRISAIGFENKLITITSNRENIQLDVHTNEAVVLPAVKLRGCVRTITMGGSFGRVIVRNIYNNKQEEVKKPIPVANVELFPNPVKRNGSLMIRWKKPAMNDQKILLYNANGIQLMQQDIHKKGPLLQEPLNLDLNAAGYYLIHIIDSKTKKKEVVSFIVE